MMPKCQRTQEQAQAELDGFRRLWREAIAKAKQKPPEHWEAVRKRLGAEYKAELVAANEARNAAPVDVLARLRDAGVEQQHLEGLKAMDERPAFRVARRWWGQAKVERDGAVGPVLVRRYPFLVLLGVSGLGKSQAAAWCLREAVRAYNWESGRRIENVHLRPFLVVRGPDFAQLPVYGNHAAARMDHADDAIGEMQRASVLVLDDLLRKPMSGPHMDRLSGLLLKRHGADRSTIITANMDMQTLEERLDGGRGGDGQPGPLWRRLTEKGLVVTIPARGKPTLLVGGQQREWMPKESR